MGPLEKMRDKAQYVTVKRLILGRGSSFQRLFFNKKKFCFCQQDHSPLMTECTVELVSERTAFPLFLCSAGPIMDSCPLAQELDSRTCYKVPAERASF